MPYLKIQTNMNFDYYALANAVYTTIAYNLIFSKDEKKGYDFVFNFSPILNRFKENMKINFDEVPDYYEADILRKIISKTVDDKVKKYCAENNINISNYEKRNFLDNLLNLFSS